MGKGLDLGFIREFYEKMSDQEILRILTYELDGLTPEAQVVIKDEVVRRRIDFDVDRIGKKQGGAEAEGLIWEEGCPLDQVSRIWVERAFLTLLGYFGEEDTRFRKVLIAERWDFPVTFDGSERSAYETLKIIAHQMDVPFERITLDFYDAKLQQITDGTPGGVYWGKGVDDNFEISIVREIVHEPERMIAVLSHEVAHVKLLGEGRMEESDEKMTDLTTIFFGMGVFNANATFQTFSGYGYFGWSQTGYLTQMEWGYALALFAYVRQEDKPEWAERLIKNVRADFEMGMQFIADNEEVIFQDI